MKSRKSQFQISFAWLFAIIVGVFILALAIYAATQILRTGETATSAKTGKEISVLLNPLETGFESARTTLLGMPVETRIHNRCVASGTFGRQIIQLSQKSFNKWTETDVDVGFSNKYIFSEGIVEGKNFFLFSKRFDFPFKVSDVIYLTSAEKEYCFVDAPSDIRQELSDLNQENIFIENCPGGSIKVCFQDSGCDITVKENLRSVEKRNQIMYYETDALMYAAVFSDKDVYECQVKRLIQRTRELALLYDEKASLISRQECPQEVNLVALASAADSYQSSAGSSGLVNIAGIADDVEIENDRASCRLW